MGGAEGSGGGSFADTPLVYHAAVQAPRAGGCGAVDTGFSDRNVASRRLRAWRTAAAPNVIPATRRAACT